MAKNENFISHRNDQKTTKKIVNLQSNINFIFYVVYMILVEMIYP